MGNSFEQQIRHQHLALLDNNICGKVPKKTLPYIKQYFTPF